MSESLISKKFCVFCGKPPLEKTKEHVIPEWLIELTGDPNRKMQLGPFLKREDNIDRKVSFEDFAFPACNKCNQFFSDIENKIKLVMRKI